MTVSGCFCGKNYFLEVTHLWINNSSYIMQTTLDKLKNQIKDLKTQLNEFENKYDFNSKRFKIDYENGQLGDNADFVEWSATIEMLNNAKKQLAVLEGE